MNFFDMLVSKSINGGGGGSGTSNYNELSNKPSINNVTLTGNKTASALGLQPEITGDVKISSDNVDDTDATNLFVTSGEKSTWSGKQDALTFDDAPTENSNNPVKSGGIYTALSGKQAAITSDNKLNPALIAYNSTYAAVSNSEKTTYAGKQDALTFDGTYSASTNKAATVSTVTNAVNALDVTGGSVAASKTLASWSEANGKVSITTQDIAITGSQAVLTGYQIAQSKQSIAATDTTTEAFGKVEQRVQTNENNILLVEQNIRKNIATINNGTNTIYLQIPVSAVANKSYQLSIGTLTSDETSAGQGCRVALMNGENTVSNILYMARGNNKTGVLTTTDAANSLWIYASGAYQSSVGKSVTVANLMLCDKALYDAGYTDYQPYIPTIDDIMALINQ